MFIFFKKYNLLFLISNFWIYLNYMIIVPIKNNENIDRALKTLKSKVIKTKQNQILLGRKEYTKKSVKRRAEILKAIHKEKKKNS
jgi:small subunit ribosomal protein S21